jgi:hypothetical protein
LVGLTLVPVLALLPSVAQAPELAPARAWSLRAIERTQETYDMVRARARALWMKEPAGKPAPGDQP